MIKQTIFKSVFLLFLLIVVESHVFAKKEKEKKYNILFIQSDDLRPELGCYGCDYVITPNIDNLAKRGIQFNQAHVQSALSNPSRCSYLTGLRPNTTQVLDLVTDFRNNLPNVVTLPQYFKNHNYTTLGIGKTFHNTLPDTISWSEPEAHIAGYPFDPDAVYLDSANVASVQKKKEKIIAAGNQKKYIDQLGEWYLKTYISENPVVTDDAYYDGAQTDVTIKRLEQLAKDSKPFFYAIGYYRPHMPFNVPKKYWDMYDRAKIPLAKNDYVPRNCPIMAISNNFELRSYTDFANIPHPMDGKISESDARLLKHGYLASVTYIDTQIGRLMDALKRLNLLDNTIIVLIGDHGWKLGEHNAYSKLTNFTIDTRTPLIISAPGLIKPNTKTDGLVEFVDIYPTLCDLAKLPIPQNLEGTSMVPLIKYPKIQWKKAVFSQILEVGRWVAKDGNEYIGYSTRTDKARYNEWYNWKTKELAAKELYVYSSDPDENDNVVDQPQYKALVESMAQILKRGWRDALPDVAN